MIKVSVIMPSLNVAGYIREAMDSVLAQTLKDIEVICVDAGSTDGTWDILEEYADTDDRVHLIRSEKKSYGYQMNLGISIAKGEYIGIVETDDFVERETYEKLYDAGKKYNTDIVKTNFDMFVRDDNDIKLFVPYYLSSYNRITYNEVYSKDKYIHNEAKVEIYIWNAIYKKSFLVENEVRFNETPGASFQDFSFRYQTSYMADSIVALDYIGYHYRRDNSDASTYNPHAMEYNLRESKYMLDILRTRKMDEMPVYRAVAREIVEFASWPYLEMAKWVKPSKLTQDAFDEYVIMMEDFENNGIITRKSIGNDYLWMDFNLMLKGAEFFMTYGSVIAKLGKERMEDFLRMIVKYHSIVIFGVGKVGNAAYVFLKNAGITKVAAFCDNNEAKQRKTIYGTQVLSVENSVERYPEALFLLTSLNNETSMTKQLNELGIDKSNILLYGLQTDPAFCTDCMVRKLYKDIEQGISACVEEN